LFVFPSPFVPNQHFTAGSGQNISYPTCQRPSQSSLSFPSLTTDLPSNIIPVQHLTPQLTEISDSVHYDKRLNDVSTLEILETEIYTSLWSYRTLLTGHLQYIADFTASQTNKVHVFIFNCLFHGTALIWFTSLLHRCI